MGLAWSGDKGQFVELACCLGVSGDQAESLWEGTVRRLAAKAQGVTVPWMKLRDPKDFEPAFSAMSKERVDAVIVLTTTLIVRNLTRIAQLALEHRLPTMSISPSLPQAGGLMSYSLSYPAMILRRAAYVDKVLKGAKPADLPVERPTNFDLVINLKTAKALGLTIPDSLLFRADRVIR